jgi:acetyl-CoA C-acetyltransferase
LGLKPLARLVAYAHAGVDPAYMGIGHVPATRLALRRAALELRQLDVIESNEAFAAQTCAVSRELALDPDMVNPNGSGISLGHPVGANGAIITTKALYELHRVGVAIRSPRFSSVPRSLRWCAIQNPTYQTVQRLIRRDVGATVSIH